MSRIFLAIALATLTFFVVAGSVEAGEGCEGFDVVTHVFDVSDGDGDGFLSPAEFDEAGLAGYGVPFEAYDADGDGQASLDEYYDLYDRNHESHEERLES